MSKRAHLHPICKIGTCGKKTLARGMCQGHYQDWRRNYNAPLAKSSADTKALILAAMPGTRRQLEVATGFIGVTILKYLPRLRAERLVYVADHEPPVNGLGRWQPVYALGDKPDRVLSATRRNQQAEDRRVAKKVDGGPVVVHVPPSKWRKPKIAPQNLFSALGL